MVQGREAQMRIILASRSEGRRKALDILGLKYEVRPSGFDEKSIRDDDPHTLAKKLAEAKVMVYSNELEAIIIGGDLFVVHDGKIFEKPADKKEAYSMLSHFSGKTQEIIGSLAVYNTKTKVMMSDVENYKIKFRKLSDAEIKDYVERYPVTTFAAGYDADGEARFAEKFYGNYPFVVSFHMPTLVDFLKRNGVYR
jgi:septum formation protein